MSKSLSYKIIYVIYLIIFTAVLYEYTIKDMMWLGKTICKYTNTCNLTSVPFLTHAFNIYCVLISLLVAIYTNGIFTCKYLCTPLYVYLTVASFGGDYNVIAASSLITLFWIMLYITSFHREIVQNKQYL